MNKRYTLNAKAKTFSKLFVFLFLLFFSFIGKAQVLIQNNFDTIAAPLGTGWVNQVEAGTMTWARATTTQFSAPYTGGPYAGSGMAWYNSYNQNVPGVCWLVSPSVSTAALTPGNGLVVSFWALRHTNSAASTEMRMSVWVNTTNNRATAVPMDSVYAHNTRYPITTANGAWVNYTYAVPAAFVSSPNLHFFFRANTDWWNDFFMDEITVAGVSSMAYNTTLVTQPITTGVGLGSINNPMIRVAVATAGLANPLNISNLTFSTTGTTSVSGISNAKCYFTGSNPSFSTANQFGTTVNNPSGSLQFNGNLPIQGTFATGDTSYFWLAYDVAANATFPTTFNAALSSVTVGGTSRTPVPTTNPGAGRDLAPPMSGNYFVGTSGPATYPTLSAAFVDLTSRGVNSHVTLQLIDSFYTTGTGESFPISLGNIIGAGPNATITIKPAVGANPYIFDNNANAVLDFVGSRWVRIDGRQLPTDTNQSLTIENRSIAANSVVIHIRQDARQVIVRNTLIRGANNSTNYFTAPIPGLLRVGGTTNAFGAGNDSITVRANRFSRVGTARYGCAVVFDGQSLTAQNDWGTVDSNEILGYSLIGVHISSLNTGNGRLFNISRNSFYDTIANFPAPAGQTFFPYSAVYFNAANANSFGNQIVENWIGGTAPRMASVAGEPRQAINHNTTQYIIWYSGSATTAGANVSRNRIGNMWYTGGNPFTYALYTSTGFVDVEDNIFGHATDTNNIRFDNITGGNWFSMYLFHNTNTNIRRNLMANVANYANISFQFGGMYYGGNSNGLCNIDSNVFRSIYTRSNNTGTPSFSAFTAIGLANSTPTQNVRWNQIGGPNLVDSISVWSGITTYNPVNLNASTPANTSLYGINTTGAISNISNNYIGNLFSNSNRPHSGAATAVICGISLQSFTNGQLVTNNTIRDFYHRTWSGTSMTGAATGIVGIVSASGAATINNNTITNLNTWSSNNTNLGPFSSVNGIAVSSSNIHTISSNTITNLANYWNASAGTNMNGIGLTVFNNNTVTNNTIRDLFSYGNSTTAAIVGIYNAAASANQVINNNAISNLVSLDSLNANPRLVGVFFTSSTIIAGNSSSCSGNSITGLVHRYPTVGTPTAAQQIGIFVQQGTGVFSNNMIRLGRDTAGNQLARCVVYRGISLNAPSNAASRIYHNNILIDAAPDYGTAGAPDPSTSGIHTSGNATTPGLIDIKNNIVVNNSINAGTASLNHYGYILGTTNLNFDHNFDLVSVPNNSNTFVVRYNNINYLDLASYRSASARGANIGFSPINFVNGTGSTSATDLHLSSPNTAEGSGDTSLTAFVSVDVDGSARNGLTPTDIGADAANFTLSGDSIAPAIYVTPLANASSTANRVISGVVFDGAAIPQGANAPRVYFAKGMAGSWFSEAGVRTSGTNRNGTYSFTINHAALGGITVGDTVRYFFVAQDSTRGNVSTSPSGISATNVLNVTPPMVFGQTFSYRFNDPIPSVVYVPSPVVGFTNYPTLTGPGGAFEAINNSVLNNNTTIIINDNVTEPGTVVLNKWLESGAGNYSLTIRPDGATQRTLGGFSTNFLLRFNNVSNLKMLGWATTGALTDTNLYIVNTNTGAGAIQFLEGGSSDTLRNLVIRGRNTQTSTLTGGLVNINPNTIANSFTNFNMENCYLAHEVATTLPAVGLMASGTSPRLVTNIGIRGNSFANFTFRGIQFTTGTGNNILIQNNHFFHNANPTFTSTGYNAIDLIPNAGSDGNIISGNFIGGSDRNASGTPWNVNSLLTTNLINVSTGIVTGTNIVGNVIQNFNFTNIGNYTVTGINVLGTAAIYSILNNRIGSTDPALSINSIGNHVFQGINTTNTGNLTVQNDTIMNITIQPVSVGASVRITAINSLNGFSNVVNISNNVINRLFANSSNVGTTNLSSIVGIASSNGTLNQTINNNRISTLVGLANNLGYAMHGIIQTGGAGTMANNTVFGLLSRSNNTGLTTLSPFNGIIYTASVNGLMNITGNTVDSMALAATTSTTITRGITVDQTGAIMTLNVSNNIVRNIWSTSNSTNIQNNSSTIGLNISSIGAINGIYSGNTVHSIEAAPSVASASVSVMGMLMNTSVNLVGNNTQTSRNFIHSLNATSTGIPFLTGMYNMNGFNTLTNNMVRVGIDQTGTAFTSSPIVRGIWHQNATQSNYWHNTVLVGGAPAVGSTPTIGFDVSSTITIGQTLDVRNNIFANLASNTAPAAGLNIGVRYQDSSRVNSNYNIIHTPGSGGVAGVINLFSSVYPLLGGDSSSFKARTGLDLASSSADPNFGPNALGTAAVATLSLQNNNPAERSGDASVSVATDFFGNSRSSNTPSDVGAHTGNFSQTPDAFPPMITYSNFTNAGSITGTRVLTNVVITDNNGIPMTGANRPRIYYSRDRSTWYSAGATTLTGTAVNATASFTIDYLNFSPALSSSDSVFYFVVAQDLAGNLMSNAPLAVGTDVNSLTQFPRNIPSYKFLPSIAANTVIPVGVGQTYTSLTNPGGLFEFLNNRAIAGNIFVEITSDLTNETGAVVLNQVAEDGAGAGTFSVTIRPNAATTTPRLIEGTYLNTAVFNGLITLVGANRVKISGIPAGGNSTQRLLRIRNTAATGAYVAGSGNSVITISSAIGVAIRNCIIEGGNASTTGGNIELRVGLNNLFTTTPCSFDTIENNIITHNTTSTQPNGGIPALPGLYSFGNPNVYNNNIVFNNNLVSNYAVAGVGVVGNNGDNFRITNNSIFYDQPIYPAITQQAIVFLPGAFSNGNTISGNMIGGTAPNAGGAQYNDPLPWGFTGIRTNVGNGAPTIINNNVVRNIAMSNPTAFNNFVGVRAEAGNTEITNNVIGDPNNNSSIIWSQQSTFYGIWYLGTNTVNINNNAVQGCWLNTANVSPQFFGIYVSNGTIGTINTNTVGHATNANSIRLNGITANYGIYVTTNSAYTPNYTVNGNTIGNMTALGAATATNLYGMFLINSAQPTVTNNTIVNLQSAGVNTATTGVASGILIQLNTNAIPTVANNTISAIRGTNTGSAPTVVNGIFLNQGQNAEFRNNRIFDITNASTSTSLNPAPVAAGIQLGNFSISTNLYNNQISLGTSVTNNIQLNGIWVNTNNSGVVVNAVNNTVLIDGTSGAGNQNTYAFLRGNNTLTEFFTNINLRNNILANRRTGGTGAHFAISNQASAATNNAWNPNTSNYNLLVTSNPSTLGQWGSLNTDITTWRNLATSDVLSYAVASGTGIGQLNLTNMFVNPAIGNLNLNAASAEAWYAYGKGITGSSANNLNSDFAGNVRSTSQGTATTIGSFHLNAAPSALPVSATASAAPAANTTTSYIFANRPVASIAWGASAPATAVVYDFTGVTPANAPTGNAFNRYVRTDISGGTAPYNYGITLNFNPANTGGVNNSNNIRVATANTIASPSWTTHATTTSNATNLTAIVNGLSSTGTAIMITGTELAAPPTVLRFNPAAAPIGASVQIIGSLFTGASAVSFNGTSQPVFTVVNDTLITTTVPAGATTGTVSVTNPFGTASSVAIFTVIPAPTISSFNPTSGTFGTLVTISGTGFTWADTTRFNGLLANFTVLNNTTITATVPNGATTGFISVRNPAGNAVSSGAFAVVGVPTITSFTPTTGPAGTTVTITGTNFEFISNVRFNGTTASYTVVNNTTISATVPTAATTGLISVQNGSGTGNSATNYVVVQLPTITSFTPSSGGIGTIVTISGSNFANIDSVEFGGGVNATFVVNNSSQITATVAAGSITGFITVYRNGVTAVTSSSVFTVIPDLVVSTVQSVTGTYNNITVTGTGVANLAGPLFALGNVVVQTGGTMDFGTNSLQGNGNFTVQSGGRLNIGSLDGIAATGGITGNVVMGGTRTYNVGGSYTYNGLAAQFTGNALASGADTLIVNNTFGVTITNSLAVNNRLQFIAGNLNLGNNNLTMNNASATILGAGTAGYVVTNGSGSFVRTVPNNATALLFPVGSTLSYSPASISQIAAGTTDNFSVRVINGVFSGGSTGLPFSSSAVNRTWIINESVAGGSNATVSLTWQDTVELTAFSRAQSAVAFYNPTISSWVSGAYGAATGTNPYSRSRANLTTFNNTAYSVGDNSGTLPVELISFTGKQSANDVVLKWTTANETNNSHFVVERSLDGETFEDVTIVKGSGNINRMVNYVSVDKDAALLGASAIYYRLKQVDFDGKFEYHGPVVVNLETTIESLSVEIYPNPFNNSINLEFNEANAGTAQVVFTDLQGRVVKSMNLEINKGYGNYQVNELDNLKDGIYLMQVSLNGVVKTKKVVKSFN
jgi:hypothetical protein